LQAATYANITPDDTGRASAIYSTQRQVAAALGVGVLMPVLLTGLRAATGPAGALSAYHAAFFVGACLVVLSALSALLIRDEDAAATIAGRRRAIDTAPVVVGGD